MIGTAIAQDAKGRLAVAWYDSRGQRIRVAASRNGRRWSRARTLGHSAGIPSTMSVGLGRTAAALLSPTKGSSPARCLLVASTCAGSRGARPPLDCHVCCSPRVMGSSDHHHRRTRASAREAAPRSGWSATKKRRWNSQSMNVLGFEQARLRTRHPDGRRFLTVGVEGDDFQLVLPPGTPGGARAGDGLTLLSSHDYGDPDRRYSQDVEVLKSRGVEFVSDAPEFPGSTLRSSRTPTATGSRFARADSS